MAFYFPLNLFVYGRRIFRFSISLVSKFGIIQISYSPRRRAGICTDPAWARLPCRMLPTAELVRDVRPCRLQGGMLACLARDWMCTPSGRRRHADARRVRSFYPADPAGVRFSECLVPGGIRCRVGALAELDDRSRTVRGSTEPPAASAADRGSMLYGGGVWRRCGRAAGPSAETFCICHSVRSCACRRATGAWRLGLWGRCGAPLAPILLHGGKGQSGLAAECFGAVRRQSADGAVCAARSVTPTFAIECLSIPCCFGLVCLHWGF